MPLLLDTHVAIWLYSEPDRVSPSVRDQIGVERDVRISVISAWEFGQKRKKFPEMFPVSFEDIIAGSGFTKTDFPFSCHLYAEDLPPIHGDPFDRMLVAHALVTGAAIVTADRNIPQYPVATIW